MGGAGKGEGLPVGIGGGGKRCTFGAFFSEVAKTDRDKKALSLSVVLSAVKASFLAIKPIAKFVVRLV